MKFIDTAEIRVKAGDGGTGMAHFRREKLVPFGGPDGGHGGSGGNVFFKGNEGLSTLLDFRYQRYHEAKDGERGGTNNRAGKRGENVYLEVPCGTVVHDVDSGDIIGEVLYHGHELLVAQGGKGGKGNGMFATSRNQAPTKTIPADPGERKTLRLELKMIADVGIFGSPNAGKSTLISVISAARPTVADYPFTTLVPTLGVVSHKDFEPFVVADVPGLIPGASEGKGLGHDFLRHIERTRVLIHLVDASIPTYEALVADYSGIINELQLYDASMLSRPRITVLSKLDLVSSDGLLEEEEENALPAQETVEKFKEFLASQNVQWLEISSAQRKGISKMLDAVVQLLSESSERKQK